MSNFNSEYIKTASAEIELLYPRTKMSQGQKVVSKYVLNTKLIEGLKKTDEIYIHLYLKPLGDSLLFLSTVQATLDYISITRPKTKLILYAQKDIKNLLKHCEVFRDAVYIDSVEKKFIDASRKKSVVMITDGDPFKFGSYGQVFNTENYVYPKFVEKENNKIIKQYRSRPARYYLTFEREVGIVLTTDPNLSMPTFELKDSISLNNSIKKKGLSFNNKDIYISLTTFVHPKERQKQFGIIRYLEVANNIQKILSDKAIHFVLFAHKDEEVESWDEVEKYIKDHKKLDVIIYDDKNLEKIAYILARMNLNIGNDTGISHLAAVSRKDKQSKLTPTIITYSRHDFGKWSTGRDNVYPIYTKLAKYLTDNNKSLSRDKIDIKPWGKEEYAISIPVNKVVNEAILHLKKI